MSGSRFKRYQLVGKEMSQELKGSKVGLVSKVGFKGSKVGLVSRINSRKCTRRNVND